MYRYALRQSASVPRFLYPAKGYGIISLTFNLFRVLHDIFILHKVIDQRYHGEDQCDPHNDIGKDLQLREVSVLRLPNW